MRVRLKQGQGQKKRKNKKTTTTKAKVSTIKYKWERCDANHTNHRDEGNGNEINVKMHFVGVFKQEKRKRFGQLHQFKSITCFAMAKFFERICKIDEPMNYWNECNSSVELTDQKIVKYYQCLISHLNWISTMKSYTVLINKLYENGFKLIVFLLVHNCLPKIGGAIG